MLLLFLHCFLVVPVAVCTAAVVADISVIVAVIVGVVVGGGVSVAAAVNRNQGVALLYFCRAVAEVGGVIVAAVVVVVIVITAIGTKQSNNSH